MQLPRWLLRKRIKPILLASIFTLAFTLSVIVGSSLPTYTQTSNLTPREKLILEIKEYAERHVQSDSSMKTEFIVDLFKENKEGLTAREISRIYEEEYNRLRQLNQVHKNSQEKTNKWREWLLNPNKVTWGRIGWGLALIFFILTIFRDVLRDWLKNIIKVAGDLLYNKLAGSPLLLGTALRNED